jgi:hypothetical protein
VLPPDDEEEPEPTSARLRPTQPGPLVALALVGMVAGWSVRPVSVWAGRPAPQVSWLPPLGLLLLAVTIGWTAWLTYRSLHRRHPTRDAGLRPLAPHQAVNRLALAKACALIGALVAGGYLGFCLSWLGVRAETAGTRVVTGLASAAAAGLLVVASLLLERACRVPPSEDEP